ncbi:MAG: NUDIX domain-containing protein [Candidatus Woesebacteria bacterium]|jgi:8-oxo-dGTP diphosphatase
MKTPKGQIAVDVVIFTVKDNQLKVLLVTRSYDPFANIASLPGGFIEPDETTLAAARRILHHKAGVHQVFIEQLCTFDEPRRDPRGRVVTVAYYALLRPEQLVIRESHTTQIPRLQSVNDVKKLAFDHNQILKYAITRLRAKLSYTNAAYSLLPAEFTLTELQRIYEIVNGTSFDKRNFRKKFLSLGLIEPTKKQSDGGRHRPAMLYRFVSTVPTELSEPAL